MDIQARSTRFESLCSAHDGGVSRYAIRRGAAKTGITVETPIRLLQPRSLSVGQEGGLCRAAGRSRRTGLRLRLLGPGESGRSLPAARQLDAEVGERGRARAYRPRLRLCYQAPPLLSGTAFVRGIAKHGSCGTRSYCVGTNFTASATTYPFAPVAQILMLPLPVEYPALNGYRPSKYQVPPLIRWFTERVY